MKNFCSGALIESETLSDLNHTLRLSLPILFPLLSFHRNPPPPPYTSCIPNSVLTAASRRTQIGTGGTRNGLRKQKVRMGFGN